MYIVLAFTFSYTKLLYSKWKKYICIISLLPVNWQTVEKEGGMESISQERRWTKVATSMGYESGKGVGGTLKCHYERLLFPYYLFKTGASLEAAVSLYVSFI